jgi:hypothetical protein
MFGAREVSKAELLFAVNPEPGRCATEKKLVTSNANQGVMYLSIEPQAWKIRWRQIQLDC